MKDKEALVARLHEAEIPVNANTTATFNINHAYGTAERAIAYVEQLEEAGRRRDHVPDPDGHRAAGGLHGDDPPLGRDRHPPLPREGLISRVARSPGRTAASSWWSLSSSCVVVVGGSVGGRSAAGRSAAGVRVGHVDRRVGADRSGVRAVVRRARRSAGVAGGDGGRGGRAPVRGGGRTGRRRSWSATRCRPPSPPTSPRMPSPPPLATAATPTPTSAISATTRTSGEHPAAAIRRAGGRAARAG